MLSPFERFILKNRVYCEHPGCRFRVTPATSVLNEDGRHVVVCDQHSGISGQEWEYKAKTTKKESGLST